MQQTSNPINTEPAIADVEAQNDSTAIMQAMREPLLVLDSGLRVRIAIRSFYAAFKSTPEQTLGRLLHELGNGQWNIPRLHTLLLELVQTNGTLNNFQVEHDFPEIGRRTMLLNARRLGNGDGKSKLIMLAIEDVTEQRAANHKLEVSEVRYRRLFESAHDGILILNVNTHRITDVNPFLIELLDYPREHFIDKELWEIGVFRDKDASQKAMKELHRDGSIRYDDMPLQDCNGRRHPVEIVANVYQEGLEKVIQCNIRDIAQRVRLEHERDALLINKQSLRMEAEAANRSKDNILATLSHEVRTPLNAILGWATILRGGDCSKEDLTEGMEVIERNCKVQAQLIEDVLDISRIVSGKMRLEIRPCELAEVIKAAIDVVSPAASAKNIHFETDLEPVASLASCDRHRIQQVVWNLLSNAIKFSPEGGTIRIKLARERTNTQIQISDEGQGIGVGLLPYVFDRFRQADSSTRRKFGGLGIGLSIVKHIIEAHGGTVRAQSEGEGRGAAFTITLPIRAVQVDTEEGEPDHGAPHRSFELPIPDLASIRLDGLRILLVDDEADARRLLVRVLEETGATISAAGSVVEALASLEAFNPQILLSDIAMPNQDGYDLIRQVRSADISAEDLPAVALTAFAHKDDRLRVLRAGFQLHAAKPIDPHELISVIAILAGYAT